MRARNVRWAATGGEGVDDGREAWSELEAGRSEWRPFVSPGRAGHELQLDALAAAARAAIRQAVEVHTGHDPGRLDARVGDVDDGVDVRRMLPRSTFRKGHPGDRQLLAVQRERR